MAGRAEQRVDDVCALFAPRWQGLDVLDIESELSKNLRVTRTQGVCARDRRRAPRGLATEVSSAAASRTSAARLAELRFPSA